MTSEETDNAEAADGVSTLCDSDGGNQSNNDNRHHCDTDPSAVEALLMLDSS